MTDNPAPAVPRLSKFGRNALSNAIGNALGTIIQFGLVLILPHVMRVEEFAGYATALAMVAVGEMASDCGGRIWATRRFALGHHTADTLVLSAFAKLTFSLGLGLIITMLPSSMLSATDLAIALGIAFLQPSTDPVLWYFRGQERFDIEAGIVLGWRLTMAASTLMLSIADAGLTTILAAWLLCSVLRIAVEAGLPFVRPLFEGLGAAVRDFSVSRLFQTMRECSPLGTAFLMMAVFQRMGVLILGEIGTKQDVANYGLAFTLAASAGFFATSITVSSFPALAQKVATGDMAEADIVARRTLRLITKLILPICLVGALAGPHIVELAYPPSYANAAEALVWLFPGLYISCLNFSLKYLLNALGLNWRDAMTVGVGIVAFPLIAFLPPWPSLVLGAAFAWTASETLIFIAKWSLLRADGRMPLDVNGAYLAISVVFWLVMLALSSVLP